MHHPTDRIAHTTAFVTPVVEHWLGGNKILNGVLGDVLLFVLFVADGSFDELCYPEYPRGVPLGINLSILLAMVRHERCFAVENLQLLVQCAAWLDWVEISFSTGIWLAVEVAVLNLSRMSISRMCLSAARASRVVTHSKSVNSGSANPHMSGNIALVRPSL